MKRNGKTGHIGGRIENRRFLLDSHGRSCRLMNKWRVSLEVERGENRRQPRPGWKKEEQKEKSLSPIAPRPIESGSRHSKGKRERERRARFERVSRPRFISVGSVSEARLRCQVVASGLKWCS